MEIPSIGDIEITFTDKEQFQRFKHYFAFIPTAVTFRDV